MSKTIRLDGGAKIAFLLEGNRIDMTIADFCNELVIPTGRETIRKIVRDVVEDIVRREIKHAKRRSETSQYFRALDGEPNPAKIVVSDTQQKPTLVSEINFPMRISTRLDYAAIETVEQLCGKSERDILKYRGIGRKSIERIKAELAKYGLALRKA